MPRPLIIRKEVLASATYSSPFIVKDVTQGVNTYSPTLLLAAASMATLLQFVADLVKHERAVSVPAPWKLVRKATSGDFLRLHIAVQEHR